MSSEAFGWSFKHSEFYFRQGKPILGIKRPPHGSQVIHIGIDDTDSARLGMCTTYLSAMIIEGLKKSGLKFGFYDFPNLVRLNPQVPNKTRGNGALAMHIFTEQGCTEEVFKIACNVVSEHAALEDDATHPGLVLACGMEVSHQVRAFYNRCLHRIVSKEEALNLARSEGMMVWGLKKGLGIIGAIAALGVDLTPDQTFELIAYRDQSEHGRFRDIDESLVLKVDQDVKDTFFNYDYENHKVCIVPASPCPVYFGLRGETPSAVYEGYKILADGSEPFAVLFRTNQHTDAHIEEVPDLASVKVRSSVAATGMVSREPKPIKGGHVIFRIQDRSGEIDCAAYEPTKQFREVVRRLIPGDKVRVYGSVRPADSKHGPTINVEKIQVLFTVNARKENPVCPKCGSRLTSMGRKGGYKCRSKGCGFRDSRIEKTEFPLQRKIREGFHEPPPVAWRHLYKPLLRGVDWPF